MLGLSGRCKKLILIFDIIGYVIRLFSSNKLGVRSSSVKGILEWFEKSLFIVDFCSGFSVVWLVYLVFFGLFVV